MISSRHTTWPCRSTRTLRIIASFCVRTWSAPSHERPRKLRKSNSFPPNRTTGSSAVIVAVLAFSPLPAMAFLLAAYLLGGPVELVLRR